jgi:hypothetical protein
LEVPLAAVPGLTFAKLRGGCQEMLFLNGIIPASFSRFILPLEFLRCLCCDALGIGSALDAQRSNGGRCGFKNPRQEKLFRLLA